MDLEEVYKRYFMDVYRYLCTISNDRDLAEELTQETFFKALQKIDRFRGECDIRTWLCQIGKYAYYDYMRKHKRLVSMEERREVFDEKSMEEEVEKREMVYRIHQILGDLGEPYREVFAMRAFEELPFREISERCGKSESWAKMTYLRARRKIREALEHGCDM